MSSITGFNPIKLAEQRVSKENNAHDLGKLTIERCRINNGHIFGAYFDIIRPRHQNGLEGILML